MTSELHPTLQRQLRRAGLDHGGESADPSWKDLLQRVSRAYAEHDQERALLERSQELASEEMDQLYTAMRADHDLLDRRVREHTEALQVSEARLASLLSLSADWFWEQDAEMRFTYISDGVIAASGFAPAELIGQKRMAGARFDAPAEDVAAYQACVEARRPFREFSYRYTRPDGVHRFLRISGEPVLDRTGRFSGYRGVGRDITDAKVAEQKVQELARYDSLTGLPNRNLFLAELERAAARARRSGGSFALCFIDLDRFKTINDTVGHDGGDILLKAMATRLRQTMRETDLVARLGGDEFVVLLEGGAATSDVSAIAHSLKRAIAEPLVIHGRTFLVTGSIGVGLYPTDGADAATILKHADAAMYLAKEKGKNNVQFYTAELADHAARQFETESALQLALTRQEFVLHFQPKVAVANGNLLGMEALVRWIHPTHGMVAPANFIPLAEERGLIVAIGRWVMRDACRQIRDWRRAGLTVPPVAVNLSARQFADENLIDDIEQAIEEHGISACDLEVELTESVLMVDPDRANAVLRRLHAMGMRIAIDDFGTGYSSLSYLKRFPAQTVKIDRSFIRGLPSDADDTAITQAVIAMAHSLGLNVVAEGVENAEQLEALRRLGCDEAQGYLLGRPMSATELAGRLLLSHHRVPAAA